MRYYMGDDGHGPRHQVAAAGLAARARERRRVSGDGGSRYRFGPRERGGALAGWRAGQIVTVAVGLVFGVLVLRWEPNAAGVAAAIGILVLYGALATVPVAGRTGDEWLPVAVCWGARRAGAPRRAAHGARCAACGCCAPAGTTWAWCTTARARTLTAALSLRGGSFALLGADEQDRRVGAWASVLSSLAREGSPVHRVQWVAASFPDDGRGVRSYLAAEADAGRGVGLHRVVRGAADRHGLAHLRARRRPGRAGAAHEVGRGRVRHPGPRGRVARPPPRATPTWRSSPCSPPTTWPASCCGPTSRTARPTGDAPRVGDPWPMAMEESWSAVRVDGMVHATFWVAEWPRIEVRSDFLAPLLLGSARSTFSVVMEPLGPDAAVRKVEASRTADLADAELRRRGGFVSTARHARESEVLARREAELAEGHASFRYSGYVTVSAPSEEELAAACDVVQHAAGQSRLALRRLYGDQASAYTCTLPLCRGLR